MCLWFFTCLLMGPIIVAMDKRGFSAYTCLGLLCAVRLLAEYIFFRMEKSIYQSGGSDLGPGADRDEFRPDLGGNSPPGAVRTRMWRM